MHADSIWLQDNGGLPEAQGFNSGDCNRLSLAWNRRRSTCRLGCGRVDRSEFGRIEHEYSVALSGHIFASQRGILADSPAHLTCRADIYASGVTGHNYELWGFSDSSILIAQSRLKRLSSGGGLTCLSVRCLSSYLIFSASFSDQQLRAKLARGHASARGSA